MTKVHKVVLLIVDHDDVGANDITTILENCNQYPNRCISPDVVTIEQAEIDWDDDHPLNQRLVNKVQEMNKLFPPTKPEVVIGYERGDDSGPTVTVNHEDSVIIRMVDAGAKARCVMTRKDVSIYQCDKSCTLSDYWVSTTPYTSWEAEDAFDVRDLDISGLGQHVLDKYQEELGAIGDDIHMIALAYYIDRGFITEDGLNLS